jgi:predicted AAA+ superfamily ATPase
VTYGKYFEQFIINEIYRTLKYGEKECRFSYLTTKDGAEIDLILEFSRSKLLAIEIKSSDKIEEKEVHKFENLAQDLPKARLLFISQDKVNQKLGNVECIFWRDALSEISCL